MSQLAVQVHGLRKSYRDFEAVRGIDLEVQRGEVFALLGPNGAGKTTTVEILEGHRKRDAGEVDVLGHDPAKEERDFKERIGIVLQSTGMDPYLTVEETVDLYRGYYPKPRPRDEIIEVVGLDQKRSVKVSKLSGGQQRRLDVAIGLAGDPELLFLDEPTTGFDPSARRNAWKMIENLQDLGKTIFLTTHYMDEAQNLADRVAIIVAGKIVTEGDPGSLGGRDVAEMRIDFRIPDRSLSLPDELRAGATIHDEHVQMTTSDPTRTLHELTGWALRNDVDLVGLTVSRPSLEDVYLAMTGAVSE